MTVIGIAGGGQLGRMLTDAAHRLGFRVIILDGIPGNSAAQVADEQIVADYRDPDAIAALSRKCDVITVEVEKVNIEALEKLEANGFPVYPTPKTLGIIRDKLHQKNFLSERGIAVAPYRAVDGTAEIAMAASIFGYPLVLKARVGGFDGRGNALIGSERDIERAVAKLGPQPCYVEAFVGFEKEVAVVAARSRSGEVATFPVIETFHRDHICHMTIAPAPIPPNIEQRARELAMSVMESFEDVGVFGIEMFVLRGEVLVNEIAPRVHNSGHWTIEGSETSQFEQHIRAVVGMPLGAIDMRVPAAVMINVLGDREGPAKLGGLQHAIAIPRVAVHMYGKAVTRVALKMGHITGVGDTVEEATACAREARDLISI